MLHFGQNVFPVALEVNFFNIIYVNLKSLNSQSADNYYTKIFASLYILVFSGNRLQTNSVENLKYPEFKAATKWKDVGTNHGYTL
jgi:hypothetical protein